MAKAGPQDITKLTSEEIEAKLKANQAKLNEVSIKERDKARKKENELKVRRTENLDLLIGKMEETQEKIATAKDEHATQCDRVKKRPAAIEQADKDLQTKLTEYQAALNLFRRGLELPYGCPDTLEEVKVFKERHIKREQQAEAAAKVYAEEAKSREEQQKIRQERYVLEQEKNAREAKAKLEITQAQDKKLLSQVNKNYGVWHKTLGAALGIAIYFVLSPAIPVTVAAIALVCASAAFGAAVGQKYRDSVIDSGKVYRSKEDIMNMNNRFNYDLSDRISALKQGVEAASWQGYFTSFGHKAAFKYSTEFKAGMIQAIAENTEVVKAIRNR